MKDLDIFLSLVGFAAGVIGILISLILLGGNLIDLFFTLGSACGLYLFIKPRIIQTESCKMFDPHLQSIRSHLDIVFTIFYILSIYLLQYGEYSRPIVYYFLIALLAALIAFDIQNKKDIRIILLKILLISMNIRWSIYFMYPGYVGIDPWYHAKLIDYIISNGEISVSKYRYFYYPSLHLLGAITSTVLGINIKNSMILSVGFFEVTSIIFIFLTSRMVSNEKIASIAALLVGVSGYHIQWGYQIISMSLGLGLFTMVFYLIIKAYNTKNAIWVWLLFGLIPFMLLTHTIVMVCMLTLFIVLLVGQWFHSLVYKNTSIFEFSITKNLFFITLLATILYWGYFSRFSNYVLGSMESLATGYFKLILAGLFLFIFTMLVFFTSKQKINQIKARLYLNLADRSKHYIYSYNPSVVLFAILIMLPITLYGITLQSSGMFGVLATELNRMEFLIFMALFCIGSLYFISLKKKNLHYTAIITASIGFIAIICISLAIGFDSILPNRWFSFMFVVASLISAEGLVVLSSIHDKTIFKGVLMLTLIFIFTLFGTTGFAANMQPVYATGDTRQAYTTSELMAAMTVSSLYKGNNIITEYPQYFQQTESNKINYINVLFSSSYFPDKYEMVFIRWDYLANGLIILPKSKDNDKTYGGYTSSFYKIGENDLQILNQDVYNKLYDSKSVGAYVSR